MQESTQPNPKISSKASWVGGLIFFSSLHNLDF